MSESSGDAPENFGSIGRLERLAEELERWGADHGTPVITRVKPRTWPFPTLVVRAGGAHINVLAGSAFWVDRSGREPTGIYGPEHRFIGRLDAPKEAAERLGPLLTGGEVSERGQCDVPGVGRR